mmetsp:Transcript_25968/g.29708  ORF Transcript_25968/g.29708 Transcript_25968/m.29708 type:complete len:319 (+) Transcript_25968:16-972(+)
MKNFENLSCFWLSVIVYQCSAFTFYNNNEASFINTQKKKLTRIHLNNFFNFNDNKDKDKDKEVISKSEDKASDDAFKDAAYDSDDPIEKIFGFFFGKREEEPMGMKRFGQERFPEQYPATTTEWADQVDTDDVTMKKIRPLLKNTNLETRGLKLTFDANREGWNAAIFHSKVDKLGGAVVVCTTKSGLVCGGYNPKGWVGYGEARGSIAAFLFAFDGNNDNEFGVTKLRKVGGPSFAQQDLPELGPSFGADSLVIPLSNSKLARSKLGSYYERFEDGTSSIFENGESSVQLKDLKVYHGVYAEGEFIPFTDAEPFALY